MARRETRKVECLFPADARVDQARDKGFSWWQWCVMTALTLTGVLEAFAVLSELPLFLLMLHAQLT